MIVRTSSVKKTPVSSTIHDTASAACTSSWQAGSWRRAAGVRKKNTTTLQECSTYNGPGYK
jgi:hypothetical protein